jgi:hypothetical protein
MAKRKLQPCGTNAAYKRHKDRKEPVDRACLLAHNAYCNIFTRRRRARPAQANLGREFAHRKAMEALQRQHRYEYNLLFLRYLQDWQKAVDEDDLKP